MPCGFAIGGQRRDVPRSVVVPASSASMAPQSSGCVLPRLQATAAERSRLRADRHRRSKSSVPTRIASTPITTASVVNPDRRLTRERWTSRPPTPDASGFKPDRRQRVRSITGSSTRARDSLVGLPLSLAATRLISSQRGDPQSRSPRARRGQHRSSDGRAGRAFARRHPTQRRGIAHGPHW